jgi:hypothetical protein
VVQDQQGQAREAARLEVDVRPAGTSSTTVRGISRGELSLLLVNRREQRVRLGELRIAVEGLRVTSVQPAFGKPLGAFEERLFTIGFLVPDCTRLVLPGRLRVSLAADGQPLERRELAVVDPDLRSPGRVGFTLGGCPRAPEAAAPAGPPTSGCVPRAGPRSATASAPAGALRWRSERRPPLTAGQLHGRCRGLSFTSGGSTAAASIDTTGGGGAAAFPDRGCAGCSRRRLVLVIAAAARCRRSALRPSPSPRLGWARRWTSGGAVRACD